MRVTDPPVVDVNEEVGFRSSEINDCFFVRGSFMIKDDLVRTCLR